MPKRKKKRRQLIAQPIGQASRQPAKGSTKPAVRPGHITNAQRQREKRQREAIVEAVQLPKQRLRLLYQQVINMEQAVLLSPSNLNRFVAITLNDCARPRVIVRPVGRHLYGA